MSKIGNVLHIGCAGAGRAGKVHIQQLILQRDVEVVAICTPDSAEQQWAQKIAPQAMIYSSFTQFLEHGSANGTRGMDAVWLSTPTSLHKEQMLTALQKGFHIFCEKPLSDNPQDAHDMYHASLQYPSLKVACAFPRRFDAGYMYARQKIEQGDIGEAFIVRSQTTDRIDHSEFFMQYAKKSGGIFVDSAIHDIDACLYLMTANVKGGSKALRPISAYGVGIARIFPQLNEWGDADNALGTVQFAGGNMATFMCSRTNAHGHHSFTEVIGSKGKMIINRDPKKLNMEISDSNGTRLEAAEDHFELFEAAFARENRAFIDWVLYDKNSDFSMEDAVTAVEIGNALQRSMRDGRRILMGSGNSRL